MAATPEVRSNSGRIHSLDALRGATVLSMLIVNNPGDGAHVFQQLDHAPWHGWTFTDLVFPFFLWIAGLAMTLSFARRISAGASRMNLFLHLARRSATIFLLGLAINFTGRWRFSDLRIMGVLQRIGLCTLLAGAIYLAWPRLRPVLVAIGLLLATYWVAMTTIPVPGFGAGVLTPEGNFAHWIDSFVLSGHMWRVTGVWDPEGLVSSVPAVATVLFGVSCGFLLQRPVSGSGSIWVKKTLLLAGVGLALLAAGQVMSFWLPINKNLWTSSYSVFMAGMASLVFAVFYALIDGLGLHDWARPLVIYGSNAIAAFVLSDALAIVMIKNAWMRPVFRGVFAGLGPPPVASLSFALAHAAVIGLACWGLWRKGWLVRI